MSEKCEKYLRTVGREFCRPGGGGRELRQNFTFEGERRKGEIMMVGVPRITSGFDGIKMSLRR